MVEYVVLTALSPQISRIERCSAVTIGNALHIGKGPHRGIVVRSEPPENESKPCTDEDISLSFSVFLVNYANGERAREKRVLKFWFADLPDSKKKPANVAQEFFKQLLKSDDFPKDYAGFIKRLLKLMQGKYLEIQKLELEMVPATKEDIGQHPAPQRVYESSVWEQAEYGISIDSSHIQEVLEHAYPTALSPDLIAKNLQCSEEEVAMYLEHLEAQGVATRLENMLWVRAAPKLEKRVLSNGDVISKKLEPTIAIITALYLEKLAIDAMVDNRETFVRYKTDGESNVYTLGEMFGHRVVTTKLSAVGYTRDARIAAGSVTTRLLGSFQSIKHVFIVGVGGGVPHYTDAARHVRLGDVIVSCPWSPNPATKPYSYAYCDAVQRNRQTELVEGYTVQSWSQEDPSIPNAAKSLQEENVDLKRPSWDVHVSKAIEELAGPELDFERPPASTDKLYMWVGDEGVVEVQHPQDRDQPKLHLGPVGSGRNVVGFPHLRLDFAQHFGICAYDNEFDTVVDSIFGNRISSWTLVRGMSDYVDGTRSKEWQPYAALQAAAVTRALVENLSE